MVCMLYWAPDGKPFKAFGNYDHDGLKFIRNHIDIHFISADEVGWHITHSRVHDHMKFPLTMVKEKDRFDWVMSQADPKEIVYMGDGPHDAKIIKAAGLGIAPSQAWHSAKYAADYVTKFAGGHGAVMEACVHVMNKMGIKHDF